MLVNIILICDLLLLAAVIAVYLRFSLRERTLLKNQAAQADELQQNVYRTRVLQEISDRVGYSLDTEKIVDIISSSLGTLLDFDTVSYLTLQGSRKKLNFRCQVKNSVPTSFIVGVKAKLLAAVNSITKQQYSSEDLEESLTGNLIDNHLSTRIRSFFNLPVFIGEDLVGLINVSSSRPGLYGEAQTDVLYSIVSQASSAVTKLRNILENEKGKLVSILNSMTDGVVMVDTENQIMVANPAVKQLLEINNSRDLTIYDLVDALAGKVDIRTKIEQAVYAHSPVFVEKIEFPSHILQLTITPVRNMDGKHLGAAATFHDITTEKDTEKLRQEFTAMIVHELRAPLTAVRWTAENLSKQVSKGTLVPEKVGEFAENITDSTKGMLELVNDLLDMAKLEAGKFELNVQENDLVPIIREQAEAFRPAAESKSLKISYNVPSKCLVRCDRVRVGQSMQNLLSNAIKYTESGEIEVILSADVTKGWAQVSIRDTGMGVSREDLPQLFSKFRQLKSTESARKGTGLGLAVTKAIVEAHGGKVWAESRGEGMGSTFFFALPLRNKL